MDRDGGRRALRVATGEAEPANGLSAAVAPLVWLLLAPLTVLVGANSAGKSSLLQSMLLAAQSAGVQ